MKKALIILVVFALILSGCSQKQPSSDKNISQNREFGRPDFGQPDRQADVTGLVKSITGNQVTIIKIERPQRQEEESENNEDQNKASNQNTVAFGAGGQRMPGGGVGMAGVQRLSRDMDADSQAAILERLKSMSTGEVTITIPIGIKMLKPDTENTEAKKQPEMLEATLADIAKDKMLNIWLSDIEAEKKTAEFVLIAR